MPAAAFHFDADALDPRNRADGVSAMLRVRDGARFLRLGLDSCIDVFDEIVAVHHQCDDDTPHILQEYAAAHPHRFKVYEYPHEVIPPGTARHAREGAESPHTIAALCNYALSKTTRRFVVKHDADHVYFPRFAEIVGAVRGRGRCAGAVYVSGVNLARSRAGELGVALRDPICGVGDYAFFPVSRSTFFVHGDRFEHLSLPPRPATYAGVAFWHLKLLSEHYGLREYRWRYEDNVAELRRRVAALEESLEVVSVERFIALFSGVGSLFVDRHCVHPLWRNRTARLLAWHLARSCARWPLPSRMRCLPLLLSFRLRRDLRGVSPPSERELASF